jgi:hypothetical protein
MQNERDRHSSESGEQSGPENWSARSDSTVDAAQSPAVAALSHSRVRFTSMGSGRYRDLCPCCAPELLNSPVKPTKRTKHVPAIAWRARMLSQRQSEYHQGTSRD